MKILLNLITGKLSPKILLIVLVSFFGGTISPDIISSIIQILTEVE